MSLNRRIRRRLAQRSERGAAIMITLMVIVLVAALAGTVTTVTINSLQASQLAQQAGVAANAADAGVAEATSYLRANGLRGLCARPTSHVPANGTFNSAFDLATRSCVTSESAGSRVPGKPYKVLIVTDSAYTRDNVGTYTVYSTGYGAGAAQRLVASTVEVADIGIPRGFFGRTISGSGTVTVGQSIFTTGCVYKRTNITMTGIDGYGLPAAVHSSQIITNDQGTLPNCSASNKSIHKSGPCPEDPQLQFDQDVLGGPFTASSPCVTARSAYPEITAETWSKYYPDGSKITDEQTLLERFNIKDPPLTQSQVEQLRRVAERQGNLLTTSSASDNIVPNGTEAVLFFDLTVSRNDAHLKTIDGFTAPSTGCLDKSLVVIVVGGSAVFPSGGPLAASVFVMTPGKSYDATGGKLVGTVYADKINLGGNTAVTAEQQDCFYNGASPHLLDFVASSYRELDR